MGSRVIVGYHQQYRCAAPFQKGLFQFGDLGGAVILVGLDLVSDIKVQCIGCGLGCDLIGEQEDGKFLTSSAGGAVGVHVGYICRGETGILQTIENPNQILFQRFQRLGEGIRLQKPVGQVRGEGGLAPVGGAGGHCQNQGQGQQKAGQAFHREIPPVR